jgi:hypothetical protein
MFKLCLNLLVSSLCGLWKIMWDVRIIFFLCDENVILLLMMVFEILNLIVQACVLPNLNWSWHKNFTNFMKVEYLLTKDNYDLIK